MLCCVVYWRALLFVLSSCEMYITLKHVHLSNSTAKNQYHCLVSFKCFLNAHQKDICFHVKSTLSRRWLKLQMLLCDEAMSRVHIQWLTINQFRPRSDDLFLRRAGQRSGHRIAQFYISTCFFKKKKGGSCRILLRLFLATAEFCCVRENLMPSSVLVFRVQMCFGSAARPI